MNTAKSGKLPAYKGRLLVPLLFALFLLGSCRSSKVAVPGDGAMKLSGEAQLEAVIANTPLFESFSSRLRLTLPSRKIDLTVNGMLRIQRDRLIQISFLIPIIRTEAARIEISPERVLLLDRLHKRYASVPVDSLRAYFDTELDFHTLQALFSNGIFLPGKYELSKKDYSSFIAHTNGTDTVELSKYSREFNYSFHASLLTNRLVESVMETRSSRYRLQWQYNNFVPVGNTTFPSEMVILMGQAEKPGRAMMELSRLSVDKQMLSPTEIPSRYEEMRLEDLFKMLESL